MGQLKYPIVRVSQRKHLRALAHANMARAGIQKVDKPRTYKGLPVPSIFCAEWKKYAITPSEVIRKCEKEQAEQQRRREIKNKLRAEKRLASRPKEGQAS